MGAKLGNTRRTGAWAGAGAAAAAVVLLFIAVTVHRVWAGDTWGQLRTGQWILEHGRLPVADDASFTAAGREVREVRWVYCVVLALAWRVGPWLAILWQAATLGAMWAVLAWSSRRAVRTPAGLALLALGIFAGSGRWVLRPEMVTYLLIAVFLVGLERLQRSAAADPAGSSRRRLRGWWLPLVQVIWSSSHSLYVFGPVLAWLFAAAEAGGRVLRRVTGRGDRSAEPRRPWIGPEARLGVVALLVTSACWVNPYFHRGAMYALEMWRESRPGNVVAETVGELRSPLRLPLDQWTWNLYAASALVAAAGATFVLTRGRVDLARLGVFIAGAYLFAGAQRNAALLAVMGTWAALRNVDEFLAVRPDDAPARSARRRAAAYALVTISAGWVAWYAATDRWAISMGAPKEFGLGVTEWDTPAAATDFVLASGARPNLFNNMRDGAFIAWRSGGRLKVFVDGRTDVYGDAFLAELAAIGPASWDAVAAKWSVNTAIVPVKGFEDLVRFLSRHAQWALVHLDHRNVVFVRRIPEHEALIAEHGIDASRPWTPPGGWETAPDERAPAWKRAYGGVGRPWWSLGHAQTFLALGSVENAAVFAKVALERFPRHARSRSTLAGLTRVLGRDAEADALLTPFAPGSSWRLFSDRLAAQLLLERERFDAAVAPLRRIVEADPADRRTRIALADAHFRLGQFDAAGSEYARALDGAPTGVGGAPEWMKLGFSRERTGDARGAADAYRRSLNLDPDQPALWNQLGVLLGSLGDRAGAAACFEAAIRVRPDYEPARRNLDTLRGRR